MTEPSPVVVFHARPKSVPGDLRISWRLSMTLLALHYCRRKRASFTKLHVLNGSLRSRLARERLIRFLEGDVTVDTCTIRIEPAFSRSLDLLVGKGLAEWLVASARLSVQMTAQGMDLAKLIDASEEVFSEEKEFLATIGRRVTEQLVQSMVSAGRRRLL